MHFLRNVDFMDEIYTDHDLLHKVSLYSDLS